VRILPRSCLQSEQLRLSSGDRRKPCDRTQIQSRGEWSGQGDLGSYRLTIRTYGDMNLAQSAMGTNIYLQNAASTREWTLIAEDWEQTKTGGFSPDVEDARARRVVGGEP
jgi:hypothetical protein